MIRTGVAELKASLSSYLAKVKAGEEVIITERGRPVARLVPLGAAAWDDRVLDLARRGVVRLPERPLDAAAVEALLRRPRPPVPEGTTRRLIDSEREERF
jgi:prevent-host-death family protein